MVTEQNLKTGGEGSDCYKYSDINNFLFFSFILFYFFGFYFSFSLLYWKDDEEGT